MKTLTVVTLAMMFSSLATAANRPTARWLYETCQTGDDIASMKTMERVVHVSSSSGECQGYIEGVVDLNGVSLMKDLDGGQAKRIFMLYLDKHPQDERDTAAQVVIRSLKDAGVISFADPLGIRKK